jgi:hypothetical protein
MRTVIFETQNAIFYFDVKLHPAERKTGGGGVSGGRSRRYGDLGTEHILPEPSPTIELRKRKV